MLPEEHCTVAFAAGVAALWTAAARLPALMEHRWVKLLRLMYHASFWFVVAGVVYSDGPLPADRMPLPRLALLYFAFNWALYGAIYTLNAMTDVEEDRAHPRKRFRPLPSGAISMRAAGGFVACGTAGAVWLAAAQFGAAVAGVFLAFLGVNLFYSFFARRVVVLDSLTNGMTYALRVLLGTVAAGHAVHPVGLVAAWAVGTTMAARRRTYEKRAVGWENLSGADAKQHALVRACVGVLAACYAAAWYLDESTYLVTRLLPMGLWFALLAEHGSARRAGWPRALAFVATLWALFAANLGRAWADGRVPYANESIVMMAGSLAMLHPRLGTATFMDKTFTA